MKFDVQELMEQRKKEILESGKYVRCEVIVGCDKDVPYINLEATGVSIKEMIKLLIGIKTVEDGIYEKYPSLAIMREAIEESDIKAKSVSIEDDETIKE